VIQKKQPDRNGDRQEGIYILESRIITMAISWLSRELGNFSREFFELTMPAIDMFEDEKDLIVKIDLAGFAKKDINLSIKEDILHIRAKREHDERTYTGSV
jgi:HSP20 family molecular chaperone IbpA